MQKLILTLLCCVAVIAASAQIGYQVSLLNNATGEPRANERVNVTVKITDSKGNIVCEESKTETTNDFGVLSMSVGNSDTFSNADWSNLPFFIEANVGGRLIGKSQLLSVPVAEHAKHTGTLTKEILCSKTWEYFTHDDCDYLYQYKFFDDGTFQEIIHEWSDTRSRTYEYNGTYEISGDEVIAWYSYQYHNVNRENVTLFKYTHKNNILNDVTWGCPYK